MDKVIRDGKVAVIVSRGFGAGWSTWNDYEKKDFFLFDPVLVDIVLNEDDIAVRKTKIEKRCNEVFPNEYNCILGIEGLSIDWVDEKSRFIVHEYDGAEYLMTDSSMDWTIA